MVEHITADAPQAYTIRALVCGENSMRPLINCVAAATGWTWIRRPRRLPQQLRPHVASMTDLIGLRQRRLACQRLVWIGAWCAGCLGDEASTRGPADGWVRVLG